MLCLQSFAGLDLETLFPLVRLHPALMLSWHLCLQRGRFSVSWCKMEPLIWRNFVAGAGEHQC